MKSFRTRTVDFAVAHKCFGDTFVLQRAKEFIIFACVRAIGLIGLVAALRYSITLENCR